MKNWIYILTLLYSGSIHGQMITNGTATGGCECYTLTTTTAWQAGSIWSPETIDLTLPFDFTFNINLGSDDGGADGIVFVLRQSGTFTGAFGSFMGYGGITNSIGVEVDTWNSLAIDAEGDIPEDHIGMNLNGTLDHELVPAIGIGNIEDGLFHDFRVTWDPILLELEVFLDGASIFVYAGDMVATIFGGNPEVYFGWTGATGGAFNTQQVCLDLDPVIDVDYSSACPGQELNFSYISGGGLKYDEVEFDSYLWTFEGGETSDIENPSHAFLTVGSKEVTLTVTNMVGCEIELEITIIVEEITIDMESIPATCFGSNDGTALAIPETGEAPFTYLWDDPLTQTNAEATELTPGIYSVLVTDNLGCEQSGTITITEPLPLLIYETTVVNASCGVSNGEIAIEVTGGSVPYQYSIDGGITFQPLATFSGLAPGDYEILVKDAKDCTVEDFITLVNVSNVPEIIITSDYYEGCKPLKVNMVNESDPTLTANTYWELGDGTTFEGESLSHTYLNAGCYELHITITTFDGCITEATFNDFICVWELPIAAFDYTPEDPDMLKSKLDFINESEFASTYEWDFGDGTVGSEFEPSHAYPPLGNVNYNVQLTAITDKGCTDITSKIILVDEVVQYYIPNSFTPDGDSHNATFRPYFMTGFYPQDFHFVIFNRYGEVLWESYDPNAGWDGTYAGTLVQDGVYIWNLTFKENQTDRKREDFGHITVLK